MMYNPKNRGMALNNYNLYNGLKYSDIYFEGEPLEEPYQETANLSTTPTNLEEVKDKLPDFSDYEDFGPYF
ncbi:MAG: hypothetical protein AAF223_12120 [Bacteroidota bacterium]